MQTNHSKNNLFTGNLHIKLFSNLKLKSNFYRNVTGLFSYTEKPRFLWAPPEKKFTPSFNRYF